MREGLPEGHGLAQAILDNPFLVPIADGQPLLTDIQLRPSRLELPVAKAQ